MHVHGGAVVLVELLDELTVYALAFRPPSRRRFACLVVFAGLAEVGRALASFEAIVLGRGELRHRLQRLSCHVTD